MEYTLITDTNKVLINKINEHLIDGWKLHGVTLVEASSIHTNALYSQALIRDIPDFDIPAAK